MRIIPAWSDVGHILRRGCQERSCMYACKIRGRWEGGGGEKSSEGQFQIEKKKKKLQKRHISAIVLSMLAHLQANIASELSV